MSNDPTLAAEVFRYCRGEIAKALADTAQEIGLQAAACENAEQITEAIALNHVAIALARRANALIKCPDVAPYADSNERNH